MNNVEKAYQFFCTYPGHTKTATIEIAERLDVSYDDVCKGRKKYNSIGETISSKEDFNEKAKVYNSVDDYQQFLSDNGIKEEDVVQVYYKQKADGIRFTVQTRFDNEKEIDKKDLYEFLSEYEYVNTVTDNKVKEPDNSFAILNIFDAHIDKLSYTGKGGYWEAKENAKYLLAKADELLNDIYFHNVERVILPIGNDFFTINGFEPTTKKGTLQQTTMAWEDTFKLGIWFYRTLINRIREFTNVHVVSVKGNHDHDSSYYLSQVIEALFENEEDVTLDLSKDKRKYFFLHKVLLMFGHGDIEKRRIKDLPTAMAIEQPENWGRAAHRQVILGDVHHKESYKSLSTLEHNGVEIKFFRPATNEDEWHRSNLWIGAKKSLSYIIYKNNGSRQLTEEYFI